MNRNSTLAFYFYGYAYAADLARGSIVTPAR